MTFYQLCITMCPFDKEAETAVAWQLIIHCSLLKPVGRTFQHSSLCQKSSYNADEAYQMQGEHFKIL